MFLDTCTSNGQIEGTLAPSRSSYVVIDRNLDHDRLGDHVLQSAMLAFSVQDVFGVSV